MTDQNYGLGGGTATHSEQTAKKPFKLHDVAHERQTFSAAEIAGEQYRPVVGHENRYQVSNLGRIRSTSIDATLGRPRKDHDCLSTRRGRDGYEKLTTSYVEDGVRKGVHIKIHRAVATAFIPNPDGLEIVHHKDNNKLNNRLENLEWVTRSQNVRYSIQDNPEHNQRVKSLHLLSSRANPSIRANNAQPNEQTASIAVSEVSQPDQRQPQEHFIRIPEKDVALTPELREAILLAAQNPGLMTTDFFICALNTAYALGRYSMSIEIGEGGQANG